MIYYFFLWGGGVEMGRMEVERVGEEMLNCHDVELPMKCSFIHVKLQLLNTVLFVKVFFLNCVLCVKDLQLYLQKVNVNIYSEDLNLEGDKLDKRRNFVFFIIKVYIAVFMQVEIETSIDFF